MHGLLAKKPDGYEDGYEAVRLDVVLPMLHGKLGEDGAIQGLLELSGIPYVGCDMPSPVVCMDKSLTYTVARSAGIATPDFWVVDENECTYPDQLSYPGLVKPARSGSSFGVSKVTGPEELSGALYAARAYDSKVLVERAVTGSEIGCAVRGERFGLVVGEVDRVYTSHTGSSASTRRPLPRPDRRTRPSSFPPTSLTSPAISSKRPPRPSTAPWAASDLPASTCSSPMTDRWSSTRFKTMPGMTSYSRYPRMMAAAGLPLSEVIDRLITLTRHGKRR